MKPLGRTDIYFVSTKEHFEDAFINPRYLIPGSKDHKIAHCNPIYEIAGSGKLDHRSLNNQGM